jgi:hypothetical protein
MLTTIAIAIANVMMVVMVVVSKATFVRVTIPPSLALLHSLRRLYRAPMGREHAA